jgi:hypothetical protein
MKAVHNPGKPAVIETRSVVIAPATGETFDLIGLSAEQMAALFTLIGNCAGSNRVLYPLYQQLYPALGLRNEQCPGHHHIIKHGRLSLDSETITSVLSKRQM